MYIFPPCVKTLFSFENLLYNIGYPISVEVGTIANINPSNCTNIAIFSELPIHEEKQPMFGTFKSSQVYDNSCIALAI